MKEKVFSAAVSLYAVAGVSFIAALFPHEYLDLYAPWQKILMAVGAASGLGGVLVICSNMLWTSFK